MAVFVLALRAKTSSNLGNISNFWGW